MRANPFRAQLPPAVVIAAAFASFAALGADPPAGLDEAAPTTSPSPATSCDPALKVPKLRSTRAADIPDAVWERKAVWEAKVRFRLDEAGTPQAIHVAVSGVDGATDDLEKLTTETLAAYRFCLPADFSARDDWLARMRFAYQHVPAVAGGDMMVQLFVPGYTRDDLSANRAGTNRVRATFGLDGLPMNIRIVAGSGDDVLDAKTVDAMKAYRIAFRHGTVLSHAMTFEQPYKYEIR